jgi:hypothetical protein
MGCINASNWKGLVPINQKEGIIFEDDQVAIYLKIDLIKFFGRVLVEYRPKG